MGAHLERNSSTLTHPDLSHLNERVQLGHTIKLTLSQYCVIAELKASMPGPSLGRSSVSSGGAGGSARLSLAGLACSTISHFFWHWAMWMNRLRGGRGAERAQQNSESSSDARASGFEGRGGNTKGQRDPLPGRLGMFNHQPLLLALNVE